MEEDLKKIAAFCETHLIPLPEIQNKHQISHLAKNRALLSVLLNDYNKWSSGKIAKVVKRNSSGVRYHILRHKDIIQVDKRYLERYSELLEEWKKVKVTKEEGRNKNRLKSVRLKCERTGKVHKFRGLGATAKFLRCTVPLLRYYKNKKIDTFLGYQITYL